MWVLHFAVVVSLLGLHTTWSHRYKEPTVGVAILLRNKEHTLPEFLTCLNQLDYPKKRMYLWIYSDYNRDNTTGVVESWLKVHGHRYHEVVFTKNSTDLADFPDEQHYEFWSPLHYKHVIQLRQQALDYARYRWVDYLLMLDADVFLTDKNTISSLISKNVPIVGPMLVSQGQYSNFWCAMTPEYYYARHPDYSALVLRRRQGCFPVPMLHSALLISLHTWPSDRLAYNPSKMPFYNGPDDDIIAFAVNAGVFGIKMYVCNDHLYGFVSEPMDGVGDLAAEKQRLINVRLEAAGKGVILPVEPPLSIRRRRPSKLGCDAIFFINLARRTRRRELMIYSFEQLGMDVIRREAVDGTTLNINDLGNGIHLMAEYRDPYHDRPMKAGEVGCFLSHYNIWTEIVEKGLDITLVLEDDVRFAPDFRNHFHALLADLDHLDWDFVYLGRKILMSEGETQVTSRVSKPLYSYWTLGYLVSRRGALRLIEANPLRNLLPVDEYIPIMFDAHPNTSWKLKFPRRNLVAYSSVPLLVTPTHYTGEPGYVSDTEDSKLLQHSE